MSTSEFALDLACHLNVMCEGTDSDQMDKALGELALLGYRRVVLPPLNVDAGSARRLRELFAAHHLVPMTTAIQTPDADISSSDPRTRRAGLDLLRRTIDVTVELGGDQMNGVPYGVIGHARGPLPRGRRETIAHLLADAAEYAHARGVAMAFEVLNRYETSIVNTAEDALDLADWSGSSHLLIHLDSFHMAVEERDVRDAIRLALPRLGFLELGQSGRGRLDRGALDISSIVRSAIDDGYEGRWGVEALSRRQLSRATADALAVWRSPFEDGRELADVGMRVAHRGWAESTRGRRASRLRNVARSTGTNVDNEGGR